jgi:hypothetical protein
MSLFGLHGRPTGICVFVLFDKINNLDLYCRSQWPRALRHEMSSLARILELWVRIPLKAWMFAFILCCVVLCR